MFLLFRPGAAVGAEDCFLVFLGIVSQWILPLVHNVPEAGSTGKRRMVISCHFF